MRPLNGARSYILILMLIAAQGCASNVALTQPLIQPDANAVDVVEPAPEDAATQGKPQGMPKESLQQTLQDHKNNSPALSSSSFQPLSIERISKTGQLANKKLTELSGLSASSRYPGLLYAINDSGNDNTLFAISEKGESVAQWTIENARNRDWEDMTRINLQGLSYLVIGDTGDNLRVHDQVVLYLLPEPDIPALSDTLKPAHIVTFRFNNGPRNVEAFAAIGSTLYLLSKEPVNTSGRQPNKVYTLDLSQVSIQATDLIASEVATMAKRASSFESWLAATLAGVDLSHPTALEFDESSNTAFVLTYREVLRFRKQAQQSWAQAFTQKAERIWSHRLPQAEALTVSPGRAIWLSSEGTNSAVWAIPLLPPS